MFKYLPIYMFAFTPKDLYMLKDVINYGKIKNYFQINTSRIDDIIFEDKLNIKFLN